MIWTISILLLSVWFAGAMIYFTFVIVDMGGLRSGMTWYFLPFIILGSLIWPWDLYVSRAWRRAEREEADDDDSTDCCGRPWNE